MGEILGLDEIKFLEKTYGEPIRTRKIKPRYVPRCCGKKMLNEGYSHGHWMFICKKCKRNKTQYD